MIASSYEPYDQPSRWERPMLIGGIVAGGLFLLSMVLFIGAIVPHMPPVDASAAERATFYAALAKSPLYAFIRLLIISQLAPMALFLGGLYPFLRRAEGGSGALSHAIVFAALVGAVLAPVAEMVEGHSLLGLSSAHADPVVATGFDGLSPVAFCLSSFPQLVVLVGVGLLLGGTKTLPRWLAWLGYVTATLGLISVGVALWQEFAFLGIFSAMLYKLWIIGVSAALLRRQIAERLDLLQPARA